MLNKSTMGVKNARPIKSSIANRYIATGVQKPSTSGDHEAKKFKIFLTP